MGRNGKRLRIDTGIFRDGAGFSVIAFGKEVRMPLGSSRGELLRRRAELIEALADDDPSLGAAPGTLRKDIPRYLALAKHLVDPKGSRKAHLAAWLPALGDVPRRQITTHDLLRVRGEWIAAGIKPKTCNNRVSALRSLYKTLDGRDATIFRTVQPLPSHRTPAVSVPAADILAVDLKLQAHEHQGWLRDKKTRARFRVRAATGRRPSEIMRAQPEDVDLKRRIWTPRDGKGGFTPGIYLTDDMVAAWQLFIEADAWGPFNTGSMAEVLRNCGWRANVRPYNLRHSVGIALSESGVDLADVQQMMGHKHIATTRQHYVPVLNSRMQHAAKQLEGRLPWSVPRDGSMRDVEPRKKTRKNKQSDAGATAAPTRSKSRKSGRKR
jgi:integrase